MKRYSVKIMISGQFSAFSAPIDNNMSISYSHHSPTQTISGTAMFKKKKKKTTEQQQAQRKAGPIKRAERAIFKIFNDKSRKRHKVMMAALLAPPALMMAQFWHQDPSTERQTGGAEQVQQYTREISQLAQEIRAFAITPQGVVVRGDAAQLVALDNRIEALAHRLALDTKISEQDALNLTRQFMREINSPIVGPQLREMLKEITDNAAYLEEARRTLSRQGVNHNHEGMQASEVVATADGKNTRDYMYDFLLAFLWANLIFGDNFRSLLRRASKRNEKLQHEEKKEQFVDHVAELRAMLTPKGQEPRPAATPLPAPESKKPATRKPSRGTGSTGPR